VVEENLRALLASEDDSAMPEGIDPVQINFEFGSCRERYLDGFVSLYPLLLSFPLTMSSSPSGVSPVTWCRSRRPSSG